VNTTNSLGAPLSGVDVEVVTNGTTIVYATPHFGGANSTTDQNGLTPWITVQYGVFTGNDTMTYNSTIATVYYSGFTFTNNSRTVDTSTTHTETFIAQAQPTPQINPLSALFLALQQQLQQQQQGAPLVYIIAGLGFAAVALALAGLDLVLGRVSKHKSQR
jgi:hypothetical protein